MEKLKKIWSDERAAIVSADWVLLCTMLLFMSLVAVTVVRAGVLRLFVNIAVGVAKQETHPFDIDDGHDDTDNDGFRGYRQKSTPRFRLRGDGETPEPIDWAPAQPESDS